MPSSNRCVFGCVTTGVTIHKFPNPVKFPELFRTWVDIAGESLKDMSDEAIYSSKSVCTKHFEEKYRNRFNRINKIAIPTLHIPGNVSTIINNYQPFIETLTVEDDITETPQINSNVSMDINNDQPCIVTSLQSSTSQIPQITTKVLTVNNKNKPLMKSVKPLTFQKAEIGNKVLTVINKDQLRLVKPVQLSTSQTPQKTKVLTAINKLPPGLEKSVQSGTSKTSPVIIKVLNPLKKEEQPWVMTSDQYSTPEIPDVDTKVLTAINKLPPGLEKSVQSGTSKTSPVIIKVLNPVKNEEQPWIMTSDQYSTPEIPDVDNEIMIEEYLSDDNEETDLNQTNDVDMSYSDNTSTATNNDHAYSEPSTATSSVADKLHITDHKMFTTRERLNNFGHLQKKVRALQSEICKLKRRNESYRRRLREVLQTSDDKALKRVTENMSLPAKIFTNIQFRESMKKPKGRRFTDEEKILARSLYNINPDCYSLLSKCFTLPSIKIMRDVEATE